MTPIYDDPNHPHYGPIRRLHVMCLQLFGANFPKVEQKFRGLTGTNQDWTERAASRLAIGIPEATVHRDMLRWFLSIHR